MLDRESYQDPIDLVNFTMKQQITQNNKLGTTFWNNSQNNRTSQKKY